MSSPIHSLFRNFFYGIRPLKKFIQFLIMTFSPYSCPSVDTRAIIYSSRDFSFKYIQFWFLHFYKWPSCMWSVRNDWTYQRNKIFILRFLNIDHHISNSKETLLYSCIIISVSSLLYRGEKRPKYLKNVTLSNTCYDQVSKICIKV